MSLHFSNALCRVRRQVPKPGESTTLPLPGTRPLRHWRPGGSLLAQGQVDNVEIHNDSDTGQWTFFALDTRSNYFDTTPMPATPAKWKYRAIYSNEAQRIGLWSNVAEIVAKR